MLLVQNRVNKQNDFIPTKKENRNAYMHTCTSCYCSKYDAIFYLPFWVYNKQVHKTILSNDMLWSIMRWCKFGSTKAKERYSIISSSLFASGAQEWLDAILQSA
jgi:hypothetical protein